MPIKRPPLINNEVYHIVIRGVGDSKIFRNESDRYRALFSLYEFNTTDPVEIRQIREKRKKNRINGEQFSVNHRRLVEIWAFYLMPNHIHLLLKQLIDKGISQFMRKFGAGYVAFFNRKYERRGHLFQGRFQAVHVKDNEQLMAVFAYIHTNGASLIEPRWKDKGIINPKKVINFLENYKWSSYPDYLGKKNFPSATNRNFLLKMMGGERGCKELIDNRIRNKEVTTFSELELE